LDPYSLDPFGYRSLWFPPAGLAGRTFRWPLGPLWLGPLWLRPDWTFGAHFSGAALIPMALMPMAWIPMAAPPRLALGDALLGDRSALGGLDLHGFPPTGLAGRTIRWPLGSLWR